MLHHGGEGAWGIAEGGRTIAYSADQNDVPLPVSRILHLVDVLLKCRSTSTPYVGSMAVQDGCQSILAGGCFYCRLNRQYEMEHVV